MASEADRYKWHVTDEEKAAVPLFRDAVAGCDDKQIAGKQVDEVTCVRFLRARKLDVAKASEMYIAAEKWRRDYGVDELIGAPRPYDHIYKYLVSNNFHKFDKHGRPLYIERTGKIHCATFAKLVPEEMVVKTHVWFLEYLVAEMEKSSKERGYPITTAVTVMDLQGLSIAFRKMVHLFGGVAKIDQDYYPERMGTTYIVRAPWVFTAIWRVAKTFLDQRTLDKIKILGEDFTEMVEDLGPECLPKEYGGTCECPGGCLLKYYTQEELEEMKIGVSDEMQEMEFEATTVPVKRGAKFHVEMKAEEATETEPVKFSWYFKTTSYDIGCNIVFTPSRKGADPVVISGERVNSHEKPVLSHYNTHEPGVLRIEWDNTYSRWTSKELSYTVKAHKGGVAVDAMEADENVKT